MITGRIVVRIDGAHIRLDEAFTSSRFIKPTFLVLLRLSTKQRAALIHTSTLRDGFTENILQLPFDAIKYTK